MTKFALLIPCLNAAHYLPRLWETVRAQRQPFDEIICYDDASEDSTSDVARSLGARVMRGGSRAGPGAARNRLAAATEADWVHFHDADDLLAPEYLARTAKVAGEDADVVICNSVWRDEDSSRVVSEWSYDENGIRACALPYLIRNPIGGINGLYRRDVFQRIGGFDEKLGFCEDMEIHLRLAENGARFRVVPEPLVIALRRETSYSRGNLASVWATKLLLLHRYAARVPAAHHRFLVDEAQHVASQSMDIGNRRVMRGCLAFIRELGFDPVPTGNRAISLVKHVLPSPLTFEVQYRARRLVRLLQRRRRAALAVTDHP